MGFHVICCHGDHCKLSFIKFSLLNQALESFILRCPRDVAPHTGLILDLSLEYLSYDPNFTDDMDEDQDEDMDGEEDEDEYGHCLSSLGLKHPCQDKSMPGRRIFDIFLEGLCLKVYLFVYIFMDSK